MWLWFFKREDGSVSVARITSFANTSRAAYLRAPKGTAPGTPYDPAMYQQPDADGWFAHDGGDCPVPIGVKCNIRYSDSDMEKGLVLPDLDPRYGDDWYGWSDIIRFWRPAQ